MSVQSRQVDPGSSTLAGTSGTLVGTSTLKIACRRYSTPSSRPPSAAVIIARVCAIRIREPTPYGPPVHPVLTSHTRARCLAIRSVSMPA